MSYPITFLNVLVPAPPLPQGRHGRRLGGEESDVDIEGFEDEDGKPKTPAPVKTLDQSHA